MPRGSDQLSRWAPSACAQVRQALRLGNTQVWISDWAGMGEGGPSPVCVVVSRNDTAGDLNRARSLDGTAGGGDYFLQGGVTIPDG